MKKNYLLLLLLGFSVSACANYPKDLSTKARTETLNLNKDDVRQFIESSSYDTSINHIKIDNADHKKGKSDEN